MDAELRVWASHLANQSLTILERAVPFDSAGRSAVLTPAEFDCLRGIDCFATEGALPSIRDFLPAAFTVEQWLCSTGLSPSLVASFTTDQQEALALELYTIGGAFRLSGAELAEHIGAREYNPVQPDMGAGEALPAEGEAPDFEFLEGPESLYFLEDAGSGEVLAEFPAEGFQHPEAAAVLGREEPTVGEEKDMLTQFEELSPDARAEFVLDGELTRAQLDVLFNLEQSTKGLKSKQVLGALTSALQRLPNPTAHSINEALVKASAKE